MGATAHCSEVCSECGFPGCDVSCTECIRCMSGKCVVKFDEAAYCGGPTCRCNAGASEGPDSEVDEELGSDDVFSDASDE